jgi:hypothetical protein
MMSDSQKARVNGAIAKVWNLMAGDAVTAVMLPTELVLNGDFDTSAGWDTNAGWTYSSGNKNVVHATASPGNTVALEYLPIMISPGGTYRLQFTATGVSAGSVTPRLGNTSGTAVSASGTHSQEITATSADILRFVPTIGFNGSIDNVSCVLVQKPLVTVAYDYDAGNKFAEGLEIDNAGSALHEARQLAFLSSYLDAQLIDIHEVDYWLINGERWDFLKDAPIQTALVPISGIHNIIVCGIRKASELVQSETVTGGFTFE